MKKIKIAGKEVDKFEEWFSYSNDLDKGTFYKDVDKNFVSGFSNNELYPGLAIPKGTYFREYSYGGGYVKSGYSLSYTFVDADPKITNVKDAYFVASFVVSLDVNNEFVSRGWSKLLPFKPVSAVVTLIYDRDAKLIKVEKTKK